MDSTQMELKKRRGEPAGGGPAASETDSQTPETPLTRNTGEPEPHVAAGATYTPAQAPAMGPSEILQTEPDRRRPERNRRRPVEGA